jgi:hypothetical protein
MEFPSQKAVLTSADPLQREFHKTPFNIKERCICTLAAIFASIWFILSGQNTFASNILILWSLS